MNEVLEKILPTWLYRPMETEMGKNSRGNKFWFRNFSYNKDRTKCELLINQNFNKRVANEDMLRGTKGRLNPLSTVYINVWGKTEFRNFNKESSGGNNWLTKWICSSIQRENTTYYCMIHVRNELLNSAFLSYLSKWGDWTEPVWYIIPLDVRKQLIQDKSKPSTRSICKQWNQQLV